MTKIVMALAVCLVPVVRAACSEEGKAPVRFAIVGLTHDHANGFIPRAQGRSDVQLVGIVEPKADLVARYAQR